LARRDPVLRRLIRATGACTLYCDADHFGVLARSIISQQISTKAAKAISGRLLQALKKLTPRRLLEAEDAVLRAAGLSANKTRALRDLAEKCLSRAVPLRRLLHLPDEEVIEKLLPVHGIGRWTAEMFLIFSLGRLDVLPVGDFGLRAGVQRHYGLAEMPGKDELTRLAKPWQPYRSIGTWYIWRSFGNVPQSE
jgi:DNA-3-methyladenine glycosylase II